MNRTSQMGIALYVISLPLFVTLKIGGILHWSWLWVLSPIWMPFVLLFVVIFVLYLANGGLKGKL